MVDLDVLPEKYKPALYSQLFIWYHIVPNMNHYLLLTIDFIA